MSNSEYDKMEISGVYVGNLLKDCTYIIPAYQRPYAWSGKEVRDLLNDLIEQNSKMKSTPGDYPFGEIRLEKTEKENEFTVADGQQRLITSYILLSAAQYLVKINNIEELPLDSFLLKSVVTNNGVALDARLVCDNPSDTELLKKILKSPEPVDVGFNKFDLAYKLCIEVLEDFIKERNVEEFKGLIVNFLMTFMITKTVTSIGTGLQAFSRANNRGKKLDDADLTKALIVGYCKTKNDSIGVSKEWSNAITKFGEINIGPSKAMQLWANAELSESSTVLRGTDVRDTIAEEAKTRVDTAEGKVVELINDFNNYADVYKNAYFGNNNKGGTSVSLTNIKNNPPLKSQSQFLAILPAARKFPQADYEILAGEVEKTIACASIAKAYPPDVEKTVASVINELRGCTLLSDKGTKKAINELKEFRNSLSTKFANRFAYGTENTLPSKVGSLVCKYGEAQLNNIVAGNSVVADIAKEVSLEHVLPQKLTEDSIEDYGSEAYARVDRFRLGNLALLEKPLNSKASNDKPSNKIKNIYNNSSYKQTKYLATLPSQVSNKLAEFDSTLNSGGLWNHSKLEARTLGLLKLLCDYLDIRYVLPTELTEYEDIQEFPQADTIDRFAIIAESIIQKQYTKDDISAVSGLQARQASYYLSAMKIANLVDETDIGWKLTDDGETIFNSEDWKIKLAEHLDNLTMIITYKSLTSASERKDFIGKHLAENTYTRRVKTLDSWVKWIDDAKGYVLGEVI